MAKSHKSAGGAGEVSFNMTPMIDCTFLLIIFFIIASQTASDELARLLVPQVSESVAVKAPDTPNRVIVNVQSAEDENAPEDVRAVAIPGQALQYKIGGNEIAIGPNAFRELVRLIREAKGRWEANPLSADKSLVFYMEVRADRRVAYGAVAPVMEAAAEADVEKMRISLELYRKDN